jgi:hypothetical protein
MRLAYIISAYRYPAQLVRLVTRLMTDSADFYIHVDKKTDGRTTQEMHDGLRHYPNVHFLEPHICHYCGFGHVEASLKGIASIVERGVPFDHAILLTGQDYPIKSNDYIADFFRRAEGTSYMHFTPMNNPVLIEVWPDALERFTHWRVQGRHRAYVLPPSDVYLRPLFSPVSGPIGLALKHCLPRRRPLKGFPPYGGSSYWNLSRQCVQYAAEFVKRHPQFVRFFKYTSIPDEHFFQTMLLNSPLRDTIVNDNLRYIDWEGCGGSSPRNLELRDFDKIAASNALFARKFDATLDSAILDKIDAEIC